MSLLRERSVKAFCWLFCCPPCPGRVISKLAFHPPEPTYFFEPVDSTQGKRPRLDASSNLRIRFKGCRGPELWSLDKNRVEVFNANTSRGHHISCAYVKCNSLSGGTKKTLLYSHGNACDLGIILPVIVHLSNVLNCNVLGYDYSGYGQSEGKPSEKNLYLDIETAWKALQSRYGVEPKDVILYGQSIGTVPTVDLASKNDVAGVVLVAPLMSGLRVAFPDTRRTWCFDTFTSIDKVENISSPLLVIHGTDDLIIGVAHGEAIYKKCKHSVEPLFIEGGGHNDVEDNEVSMERLMKFVNEELAK